jgi:two-component system, OmpR family, phosphate regulon response regulator PhoB
MTAAPLVLIVDDEPDLVAPLDYALSREGFRTRTAATGAEALRAAALSPPPNLVLLDWMLPDLPGPEVFRRLRAADATQDIPIIMVTARADEVDRIVGLELGADDYVTKPFNTRELILRVRAVLRRLKPAAARRPDDDPPVEFGRLRIDGGAHQAWVDGQELLLTALEFRLLLALYERRGRVQTRDQLLAGAWEDGITVTERTVDTHVTRLRRKLGTAAGYVETIRGVGYRFASQPVDA